VWCSDKAEFCNLVWSFKSGVSIFKSFRISWSVRVNRVLLRSRYQMPKCESITGCAIAHCKNTPSGQECPFCKKSYTICMWKQLHGPDRSFWKSNVLQASLKFSEFRCFQLVHIYFTATYQTRIWTLDCKFRVPKLVSQGCWFNSLRWSHLPLSLNQWFLIGGEASINFQGGEKTLRALQHEKFDQ